MKRIWSEENKYDKWLQVELAVCEAWTDEGVIPQGDMKKIRTASFDIERAKVIFETTRHDMTAFLRSVTEQLGNEGRWIHLGLTTSDVWDTSLSMQIMESVDILLGDIDKLMKAVADKAVEYKDTMMMGRTHGVYAEPITFGLKMALWYDELTRQKDRLCHAQRHMSVGKISGAVGTHATVSPSIEEKACGHLGLDVAPVSSQIIQRDRHAYFVSVLGLIAASLEKFATEVRSLQRTEVREVEEPFGEGQTGSSSMPHKRNPELSERVCGLSRLIRGNVITSLENVTLWHERDISHSSAERVVLPDVCTALDYMIDLFTGVISGLNVRSDQMWRNIEASGGLVFSQRVLLTLVEKGLSREEAYGLVQSNAMRAWDDGVNFTELVKNDEEISLHITEEELDKLFDYNYYVRHIDNAFKRVGLLT